MIAAIYARKPARGAAELAVTPPSPSRGALLWRQYALLTDLYKGYLELALKFNVFFYAVTGAILSFYLNRCRSSRRHLRERSLPISPPLPRHYERGGVRSGSHADGPAP